MPPSSPRPTARPLPRRPQVVAAAGLVVALVAAALVALGGAEERGPSVREQYGGHGGEPAVRTGTTGRVALDGRWRVALDPEATGHRRGFQDGAFDGPAVRLPYVPNARRITGRAGERSFEGSVAWYRTRLRVPATGRYAIRFESVNHRADVWLDGRHLTTHVGTYLPFEVRPRLEAGRQYTLVVRADWRDPEAMKAAGWHRAWFNYGGINREVTIRPVTGPEIPTAAVRTTLHGDTARVEVAATVRGGDGGTPVSGTLRHGQQEIAFDLGPAGGGEAGGDHEVRATVEVPGAALWSPAHPNLYDLELRVGDRPAWRGGIGLREIARDGHRLLLNGRELKLRGASLHEDVRGRGDGLRPEDHRALVADLEELGANATRAQHPLSPALVELLDEKGILVWMGVGPVDAPGAWTSRGPALEQQARERVRTSVAQLQTHPSIFAWNLANEVAGDGHPAGQAPWIDAMAAELQRRDPGRLVGLDVWGSHPPREDSVMYRHVDAIGWTNYLGWYEQPYATPAELEELIRTKLGALRDVFPDRVIVVTEFGAEGTPRNPDDEPGGHAFQARVLRTHIRTYGDMAKLSGMLVWNLRDFGVAPSFGGGSIRNVVETIDLVPGLNEKGLWDYDGRPKPAARAVREEFERLTRRGRWGGARDAGRP